MAGVVLHPLAEVGIGMFVAIVIGARELVVDFESHRERRHAEQHTGKEQRDQATGTGMGGATNRYHSANTCFTLPYTMRKRRREL